VVDHLPSKCKALSSNATSTKKKKMKDLEFKASLGYILILRPYLRKKEKKEKEMTKIILF
jgi:hypothetical protein